jgi:hypothetical protein
VSVLAVEQDIVLGCEGVLRAGDFDLNGAHDCPRLRWGYVRFFENFERFSLHRHDDKPPARWVKDSTHDLWRMVKWTQGSSKC